MIQHPLLTFTDGPAPSGPDSPVPFWHPLFSFTNDASATPPAPSVTDWPIPARRRGRR